MQVTWAKGYRYLGLPMTADLDWGPYFDKRVANLNYGYARYFRYNSVIHRLPLCAQVQLLQTLVISGVNYLIGALPTTAAQSRKMDAAARRSVRRIFGIPSKAPTALVDAEATFLPFSSTILMHQIRLYLSIKHNPFQQIPAAQILKFEEAAKVTASSFTARTTREIATLGQPEGRGADAQPTFAMPKDISSPAGIHNVVVCLKRADAFRASRTDLPHGGVPNGRHAAAHLAGAAAAAIRPPATPPKAHVSALHCVGIVRPADLGNVHYATPFSCVGSGGCSGGVLRITDVVRGVKAGLIMKLRMGRAGFSYPPFRRRPPKTATSLADAGNEAVLGASNAPAPASQPPATAGFVELSSHPGHCPMCNADGRHSDDAHEDSPFHLLCECTHPAISAARGQLQAAAPPFIAKLCKSLAEAGGAGNARVQAAATAAAAALAGGALDWSSADGKHVLYRMVLATPFPAAMVVAAAPAAGPLPLSLALGTLFDSVIVPTHPLRRPCGLWALWASLWAHNLTAARGAVLAPAPAVGVPPMTDADGQDSDDESMRGGSDDSDSAGDSE